MRPGALLWFEAASRLLLEEAEKAKSAQPVTDKDQDVSTAADAPEPDE